MREMRESSMSAAYSKHPSFVVGDLCERAPSAATFDDE